jgi:hypothetical protein
MRASLVGATLLALFASDANAAEKWGPTWSEVTGNLWSKTQMNRTAAIIKRVDGRDKTDRVVKIEPGKRSIVVAPPMRKGFTGDDATLDVELAPCQRYYINAQFASGTGTDWKPVLAKVETIPGCKAPKAS